MEHGFDGETGGGAGGASSRASVFEDGDDGVARSVGGEVSSEPGVIGFALSFGSSGFACYRKFAHVEGAVGGSLGMSNDSGEGFAETLEGVRREVRDGFAREGRDAGRC